MAEKMRTYNLHSATAKYENHAKNLDAEVSLIRGIILKGFATQRTVAEAEEELK
jgi:two-component system chemotaxis response regulator CheB